MILDELFLWFYCLGIPEAVILTACATLLFLHMKQRWGGRRRWRAVLVCLWVMWGVAALYVTLLGRDSQGTVQSSLIPLHSYRAVLAGENPEILRSNFMNVALFFPGGMLTGALLPRGWPRWGRVLGVLALLAALSAGIEYIQFSRALGQVEVDDVLHNALGALLGGVLGCLSLPERGSGTG